MKERGLLHPALAELVACMGHGDSLCIADAGLPIQVEVQRIDLAFAPGRPGFLEVLAAVLSELRVESYVLAKEAQRSCPELVEAVRGMLPHAEEVWVRHEELKQRVRQARGVVRTGEFTPYANVIVHSGVPFSAGSPIGSVDG
jgi:D-ribose pyranase